MSLTILGGAANPPLLVTMAARLGVRPSASRIHRFPDGEVHVELHESVRGCDVYILQPTSPPVNENLLELLLLADACRRAGSARLTAVMPYFGYARQDRRASGREAVGARLVAQLIEAAGFQRIVVLDPHTAALEGFFCIPVEQLSAEPLLAEAAEPWAPESGVVVAPDFGAAKLAERYAKHLGLPVAIVHKTRLSGEEVSVTRITGEVRDLAPLIVDDMISTGATIAAAIDALVVAGCRPEITVVATHGLLVGPAVERLSDPPLRRLVVTDSVPPPADVLPAMEVVGLAQLLGDAIGRLHDDRSLEDLVAHH